MSYECPHCDTTKQWSCNCWQTEAAHWKPDQTERCRWVKPSRQDGKRQ